MDPIVPRSDMPAAVIARVLDYRNRSADLRRWWTIRRVMAGLLLSIIGLMAWRFGYPFLLSFSSRAYWQRQCMSFDAPSKEVAYEREQADPAELAQAAIAAGGSPYDLSEPPVKVEICRIPECWTRFMKEIARHRANDGQLAILFCHERVSPAGYRRLVVIEYPVYSRDEFVVTEIYRSSYGLPGQAGPAVWEPFDRLDWGNCDTALPRFKRIFAGQADPADQSHFTIEYEWPDGLRGFLDGYLNDDGAVRISVRPGPGDIESERKAAHKRWPTWHNPLNAGTE